MRLGDVPFPAGAQREATVLRAVSIALVIVVAASLWHPATRPDLRKLREALGRIAEGAALLVAAAGSVGIILGMVTLTGLGTRFPAAILSVAGEGLLPALLLIMVGSVVLGMGLPSAVCYLLMAILNCANIYFRSSALTACTSVPTSAISRLVATSPTPA